MTEMYWKLGMIIVIPLLLILWWCLEDTDPAVRVILQNSP